MQKQVIEIVEDIVEEDSLNVDYQLDEDNWDSMNVISFIAAVNTSFNLVLDAEKVSKATSILELIEIVSTKN